MKALASRLRGRIELVRPTRVPTGRGGNSISLVPIATRVPAEVLGLSGSEAVKEKLLRGIRVYRITIRWRAGILTTDQVRLAGELLNIRSAVDPDDRRRELVLHCDSEGVLP